jgi:hypothetical protein
MNDSDEEGMTLEDIREANLALEAEGLLRKKRDADGNVVMRGALACITLCGS